MILGKRALARERVTSFIMFMVRIEGDIRVCVYIIFSHYLSIRRASLSEVKIQSKSQNIWYVKFKDIWLKENKYRSDCVPRKHV
jgi:hypothetical protein